MGTPSNILLLDDDAESMEPLKSVLESIYGYTVELTAAASLLARLSYQRFDLICVDIMIYPYSVDGETEVLNIHYPDVNWHKTGIEFLYRLRRGDYAGSAGGTRADVPVIVLSAVAQFSVEDLLKDNAVNIRYREKPFDLEELVGEIGELIALGTRT